MTLLILTCSNTSFIVEATKKCLLRMSLKSVHSMRMCLTVSGHWQVTHTGCTNFCFMYALQTHIQCKPTDPGDAVRLGHPAGVDPVVLDCTLMQSLDVTASVLAHHLTPRPCDPDDIRAVAYAAVAATQSLIAADIRTGVNYYLQKGGLPAVNTWLRGVVNALTYRSRWTGSVPFWQDYNYTYIAILMLSVYDLTLL